MQSPTDPSCHSGTPNLLLMPLPGSGSLWAPTNGFLPAGGTPTGGKAPRPPSTPAPRPRDRRGATPEWGWGRTAPGPARAGSGLGAVPEVGGLCPARWSGRRRCPSQLRDSGGQTQGSPIPPPPRCPGSPVPGAEPSRLRGTRGEGKQQLDGTTRCLGGAHSGEGGGWTEPLRAPCGGVGPGLRLG